MADQDTGAEAASGAWSAFWQLSGESAAYRAGGPQEEILAAFWQQVFAQLHRSTGTGRRARVLDIACGNGAVTRFALEGNSSAGEASPWVVGMDSAGPAVSALRARFPAVGAVRADARHAPFAQGCFDLVASQFGLEYGGPAAFAAAARLVAPGGALVCVLHRRDGPLYRECEANLRAIGRVRASQVLAAAKEVFRRGASVLRGQGSRAEFQRADARLAAAVNELDALLREEGEAIAGGAVLRLFDDLGHMYRRLGAYDPAEVADWADRMHAETEAYAMRMSAMLAAALDAAQLQAAAASVREQGLALRLQEEMRMGPGDGEPAAWILAGDRT